MSGYKAIRALKEANKSQSRLIEKQAASIKALEENRGSRSRLLEKALTRNGALEGVVEAAKHRTHELQYALVGGNTDNENIPKDVVEDALKAILNRLEEV